VNSFWLIFFWLPAVPAAAARTGGASIRRDAEARPRPRPAAADPDCLHVPDLDDVDADDDDNGNLAPMVPFPRDAARARRAEEEGRPPPAAKPIGRAAVAAAMSALARVRVNRVYTGVRARGRK
jgi:hypothetical protein